MAAARLLGSTWLAVALLVPFAGCGADRDDSVSDLAHLAQDEFEERDDPGWFAAGLTAPSCGEYSEGSSATRPLDCFSEAAAAGDPAGLLVTLFLSNGDSLATWWYVGDGDRYDVYTRDRYLPLAVDSDGAVYWSRFECWAPGSAPPGFESNLVNGRQPSFPGDANGGADCTELDHDELEVPLEGSTRTALAEYLESKS